jgi:hypothetical protein
VRVSIHIDEVGRVDALLIDGNWLGVDPGTLQRHMPMNRSSSTTAVVYRWSFAGQEFMTSAEDVRAVRLSPVT